MPKKNATSSAVTTRRVVSSKSSSAKNTTPSSRKLSRHSDQLVFGDFFLISRQKDINADAGRDSVSNVDRRVSIVSDAPLRSSSDVVSRVTTPRVSATSVSSSPDAGGASDTPGSCGRSKSLFNSRAKSSEKLRIDTIVIVDDVSAPVGKLSCPEFCNATNASPTVLPRTFSSNTLHALVPRVVVFHRAIVSSVASIVKRREVRRLRRFSATSGIRKTNNGKSPQVLPSDGGGHGMKKKERRKSTTD